ncbi:MAG: NAD(P)/FAD-dependent oxidoreductase [Pyrinomonadaceae bacterium]|nr:NAD(P)/FAD-dependent oxidoreductase [Pyrinomonadaceae bacterium]
MSKNIAIIGSGFLGLTLAQRLSDEGNSVTLYEAADRIGGLASAWSIGDVTWDRHYHVTLLSDSATRGIVEAIGLGDEFEWVETKTGFFTDGKLYSMSNSLEFLKFPPLGLIGKLRLGATIFYASKVRDWKALEKVSVDAWLTKYSGKKTFEKIWKPLLRAKLGDSYKKTSAAFIWATIQRMYAARNSGLKKEMFGYVRGGYSRVLKRFAEVLHENGVEIELSRRVTEVGRENERCFVLTGEGRREFDEVVVTCNPGIAAKIIPSLEEEEKERLSRIKYLGIVCASVLIRDSISEFYVTNITDESPFTGIIEMSALVDKEELGGNALVYLPKYVEKDDPLFSKTDDELEDLFLGELDKMFPQFKRETVEAFRVSRVKEVFPLPEIEYSTRVPGMKCSVDGVYLVNSSQITNGTLNVNETVLLAEKFLTGGFID